MSSKSPLDDNLQKMLNVNTVDVNNVPQCDIALSEGGFGWFSRSVSSLRRQEEALNCFISSLCLLFRLSPCHCMSKQSHLFFLCTSTVAPFTSSRVVGSTFHVLIGRRGTVASLQVPEPSADQTQLHLTALCPTTVIR